MSKIQYYDLRLEAQKQRLPELIGRTEEQERLSRVVSKSLSNNCLVVGSAGIGKTTLLRAWAGKVSQDPAFAHKAVLEFKGESFNDIATVPSLLAKFTEAFSRLPESIVLLDNLDHIVENKLPALHSLSRLLKPVLEHKQVSIIASLTPQALQFIEREAPALLQQFEVVTLKEQNRGDLVEVLKLAFVTFRGTAPLLLPPQTLELIVDLSKRFTSKLGVLPQAGVKLLDESIALARIQKSPSLEHKFVYTVSAGAVGIPVSQLQTTELERIKNLEPVLKSTIIGQDESISKISSIVSRAALGLKNPNRPLASFLVLGPSGVGKTETAKLLAELMFGKKENFLRLDMSEFAEAHTTQRLLGAPAGYVGFEAGGGLTGPIKNEPYSLVLLDEIEKAHPKIFDIFLQVLDDGRLTSGQGETVDFTQTILMATSNVGVDIILEHYAKNTPVTDQQFISSYLVPEIAKHFRLEFINRFDAILVFKPLSEEDLYHIAELEIRKIEQRTEKFNIAFELDPVVLKEHVKKFADPRFGARPLKRFIEETCETLISEAVLNQ